MCTHSNVFVTFECVGMSKLMTQSTCGMSKPRDATSVASSTERDFDLNLFREPRRLFYTQHKPLTHRLLHSRNPDIHTCVIVQVFLFSQESNSVFTQAHKIRIWGPCSSPSPLTRWGTKYNNRKVCVPDSFVHGVGWQWCPGSSGPVLLVVCCYTYCRKPWTSFRLIHSVWRPGSSPETRTRKIWADMQSSI